MNKKKYLFISMIFTLIVAWSVLLVSGYQKTDLSANTGQNINAKEGASDKIYVAVEDEGVVAVIDADKRKVIKKINLSDGGVSYMAHNVQVAPDGQGVWVTGNAMDMSGGHSLRIVPAARASEGHGHTTDVINEGTQDQVIVIDPKTDMIVKRIPIGNDLHLAHVVLTPDSSYAIVDSQTKGEFYKINARTFEVEKTAMAPLASEPHGLRISYDGKFAYIAMLKGRSLGVLDVENFTVRYVPLDGAAVQTGVTPDGRYAVASVYDTKKLAVYDIKDEKLSYVALPQDAKGPVQVYPSPDSKFIYAVDQGFYFDQPIGDTVYKIDLVNMEVVKAIKAGDGPHGVVVTKDGKYAYVTNIVSGDVSVIDASLDQEVAKIKVGDKPNGISVWSRTLGGTQ